MLNEMVVPAPSEIRLGKAKEMISRDTHWLAASNALFMAGDHWQNARAWMGPRPRISDTNAGLIMKDLRLGFVFRNVIEEIADNHTEGVMGREPGVNLTPRRAIPQGSNKTPEEEADIDEVEAAFTDWMGDEDRDVHGEMCDLARTLLWAGRSAVRVYIPEGYLTPYSEPDPSAPNGVKEFMTVEADTLAEAMSRIHIMCVPIHQGYVFLDPDTRKKIGIYIYKVASQQYLEISWIDDEGMTVIRTINGNKIVQDVRMDLGGRIHIIQARRRGLLIDESLQQLQKALNLCLTCLPKNVITGGWLERVLLNAQAPGEWTENEAGEKVKFVPKPYYTGPNTTNFVQGAEYEDEDASGNKITRMANASVAWREPIPVDASVDGERALYTVMMEAAKQGHLVEGNDYTSGRAKIESRNQYTGSLRKTKRAVEPAGRAVFETVLAMCEHILNIPGRYTEAYRVLYACKLDAGAVPAEERAQYAADVENFLLPHEDAMEMMGVDDVDAALIKIAADPRYKLQQAKMRAEALAAFMVIPGMTFEVAGKLLGLPEGEQKLLRSIPPPDPKVLSAMPH